MRTITQFPATVQLSDLNGQYGFKIDGENQGDAKDGICVRTAGDVNGDGHDDLIIGVRAYSNSKGRTYVIFGGPQIGSSGLLNLSSLNGTNGFKLDGESNGDVSGAAVSTAGDINGDGYDDLIIGAMGYSNQQGRSYVVFGGPEIGGNGVLSLSSLNGTNGFKLDGENTGDLSSCAVGMAGDINSDGYSDILIGAVFYDNWKGRSYLIFGGPGIGNGGLLPLSSLNGINGFKIDGEVTGDINGGAVGAAGDINDDGYQDMLVAAPYHASYTGRSYVVFGGVGVGSRGLFNLSSLTGVNGFKLDGETSGDSSGSAVGFVGDINGDQYADFSITTWYHANSKGRIYLVFGGQETGGSGLIALSSLNGLSGFKLDGENNNDLAGSISSLPVDINGDGYDDLLIGAPGYLGGSYQGCSYVVFGGPEIGNAGIIDLSNLDGVNGFKLYGESNGDSSGNSVSIAGDINQDGIDDLIIAAPGYNSGTGRSYVVFGDVPPVLVNNRVSLYAGSAVIIDTDDLATYDLNHNNNTLLFIPTDVFHGQFEAIDIPSNFTQQRVLDGDIQFVHDGSETAPSYNITVRSSGIAWTGPSSANITFSTIFLINNQLIINQGQTVIFTEDNLSANSTNPTIYFLISDLQHGQFELTSQAGKPIMTFQQQDITAQQVCFVQDGSTSTPAYTVAVGNGNFTTPFQAATIDFDALPILEKNTLWINQGQTVVLTVRNLTASHNGEIDPDLSFLISNLQHGHFQWTNTSSIITSFQQENITHGLVSFTHDNSRSPPSYLVSATDGRAASIPQAATIYFNGKSEELEQSAVSLGVILGSALGGVVGMAAICFYAGYRYWQKSKMKTDSHLQSPLLEETPLTENQSQENRPQRPTGQQLAKSLKSVFEVGRDSSTQPLSGQNQKSPTATGTSSYFNG